MGANEEKDKNNNLEENGQGTNDQTDETEVNSGNETGTSGKEEKTEKTFTQAEVNRMMAREKHQGVNSVYNELGIKPGDKKTLSAIKEYLASQKSDEQKALEAEAAQASEIARANERAAIAEAKAEAMMIGVQTQFVEDATTLALAKVAAEDGTDIKTALGELKTKYPIWFGAAKEDSEEDKKDKDTGKSKVGQKGTGSSVKASEKDKGGEAKSLGARLAAKKHGTAKSTYWGARK